MQAYAIREPGRKKRNGANDRSRTDDLFITSELLYQLSYIGLIEERSVYEKAPDGSTRICLFFREQALLNRRELVELDIEVLP